MWQPIDAPEDETTIVVRGKVWHQEGSRPWGRMLALQGPNDIQILDEHENFLADCMVPDDIRLCRQISDANCPKGASMETRSLTIVLGTEERSALYDSARRECRRPQDQARYLLRLALLGAEESPPAAPAAPATSSNDKRAEDVETGEVNK